MTAAMRRTPGRGTGKVTGSRLDWGARPTDLTPSKRAPRSVGMRLGYFTMPVHPMNRNWTETLKEDREAIILSDKLGFHDAFMGEHLTDRCENVTNSMLFQATLISEIGRAHV